jgi:hypothetical protein
VTVGDRIPVRFEVRHPDTIEFVPLEGRRDLGEMYLIASGEKSGGMVEQGVMSDTLFAFAVPFRTGRIVLPPVALAYETVGGARGEVMSDSGFIDVQSVLPGDAADIKPLKSNVPAPSELLSYILMGLIACVVIAAGVLTGYFLKRRKKPEQPVIEAPPRPAHEIAFEELQRIEESGLLSEGKFKEYYTHISETIRKYVGSRYAFNAMDLTSAELIYNLQKRNVGPAVVRLRDLLGECDLVKFAKFVPPYDEMELAIERARDLVRSTMEGDSQERLAECVSGPGGEL